jgi:hypothetical protein
VTFPMRTCLGSVITPMAGKSCLRGPTVLPKKTWAFLDFGAPRLKHRLLEEIAIL